MRHHFQSTPHLYIKKEVRAVWLNSTAQTEEFAMSNVAQPVLNSQWIGPQPGAVAWLLFKTGLLGMVLPNNDGWLATCPICGGTGAEADPERLHCSFCEQGQFSTPPDILPFVLGFLPTPNNLLHHAALEELGRRLGIPDDLDVERYHINEHPNPIQRRRATGVFPYHEMVRRWAIDDIQLNQAWLEAGLPPKLDLKNREGSIQRVLDDISASGTRYRNIDLVEWLKGYRWDNGPPRWLFNSLTDQLSALRTEESWREAKAIVANLIDYTCIVTGKKWVTTQDILEQDEDSLAEAGALVGRSIEGKAAGCLIRDLSVIPEGPRIDSGTRGNFGSRWRVLLG